VYLTNSKQDLQSSLIHGLFFILTFVPYVTDKSSGTNIISFLYVELFINIWSNWLLAG
jgi:hypothetical protein